MPTRSGANHPAYRRYALFIASNLIVAVGGFLGGMALPGVIVSLLMAFRVWQVGSPLSGSNESTAPAWVHRDLVNYIPLGVVVLAQAMVDGGGFWKAASCRNIVVVPSAFASSGEVISITCDGIGEVEHVAFDITYIDRLAERRFLRCLFDRDWESVHFIHPNPEWFDHDPALPEPAPEQR